ncbi:MAG: hypothetical protein IJX28_07935 [Clostridia bacterium]|nr:hypothetical protein [Clostridia bacterium]
MKIYHTLLIGSGHTAVGYAIAQRNTLICEESEACEPAFSLALKQYRCPPYTPQTPQGRALLSRYDALGLFANGRQNLGGLECGLCEYVLENGIEILLKCRVIAYELLPDATYDVTLLTNAGLEYVRCRRLLDLRHRNAPRSLTILFESTAPAIDLPLLSSLFPTAWVEPTFDGGYYALHIPASPTTDYNQHLPKICNRWASVKHTAKILYIAPRYADTAEEAELNAAEFGNPIAAFEAGIALAKAEKGGD